MAAQAHLKYLKNALKSSLIFSVLFVVSCSQVAMIENSPPATKGPEVTHSKFESTASEAPAAAKVVPHHGVIETRPVLVHKTLSEEEEKEKEVKGVTREKVIHDYCAKMQSSFDKYGWGKSDCENYPWQFVRTSVKGDPLLWSTFGTPQAPQAGSDSGETETTLIMCGVHGDEITPIKFCFDILNYLTKVNRGEVMDPHTNQLASLVGKKVIVAPLVNPDSYFKKIPTRTNANGVDVNRNFPTQDFLKRAHSTWASHYQKDKRRNPGKKPMSEPETVFQVNLIYRYKPNKIISVHSPLTMLDYDGPASEHEGGFVGSRANQLLIRMSEQAKGYRIKNYPFFPGSLGNYAGNERNIPTFTLELPTSDPAKASSYWKLFKESIHSAVMHEIKGEGFIVFDQEENPIQDSRSN